MYLKNIKHDDPNLHFFLCLSVVTTPSQYDDRYSYCNINQHPEILKTSDSIIRSTRVNYCLFQARFITKQSINVMLLSFPLSKDTINIFCLLSVVFQYKSSLNKNHISRTICLKRSAQIFITRVRPQNKGICLFTTNM